MNTSTLLLIAVIAAGPSAEAPRSITPASRAFAGALRTSHVQPIVRGQNADSPFFGGETGDGTAGQPPIIAQPDPVFGTFNDPNGFAPVGPGVVQPGIVQPGVTTDPWLGGGVPDATFSDPFSAAGSYGGPYGVNGPQPYRYGWNSRYDFAYLPSEDVSPGAGEFEIIELNFEKEFVGPTSAGGAYSIAPQFDLRFWEGPNTTPGLPGEVYRFGLGLKLASPEVGGWSSELGFNPAIATDFNAPLSSDALQYDAHAIAFWRWSPQFMWALGITYWDRVDDIVLPYGGVVYTPNDYLELRLIFPKPRADVFVGTPFGVPTWLYVAGEYHVESYGISLDPGGPDAKIQLEDIRVTGGARWEWGDYSAYIEAGYVFDRDVEFDTFAPEPDIDDGFIGRIGFRY